MQDSGMEYLAFSREQPCTQHISIRFLFGAAIGESDDTWTLTSRRCQRNLSDDRLPMRYQHLRGPRNRYFPMSVLLPVDGQPGDRVSVVFTPSLFFPLRQSNNILINCKPRRCPPVFFKPSSEAEQYRIPRNVIYSNPQLRIWIGTVNLATYK